LARIADEIRILSLFGRDDVARGSLQLFPSRGHAEAIFLEEILR